MIDPKHRVRPAAWHYEVQSDGAVLDNTTGEIHRPREETMTEIRLELTEETQLQDLIEFAELARRYGDKTQRGIVQATEGNRQRQMLVFKTQHSKINTEPQPAKRNDPRVVDYVDLEHRARTLKDLSKVHKNSNAHRTYHHS